MEEGAGDAAALVAVVDADEWGVKVFLTAAPQAPVVNARSGRDYLEKKAQVGPRTILIQLTNEL